MWTRCIRSPMSTWPPSRSCWSCRRWKANAGGSCRSSTRWNDVPAAPGYRTHGDKGGNFALVGPNFKGTLPAGLEEIRVDTSLVAHRRTDLYWRQGRLCGGSQDSGPVQADSALALERYRHGLHAACQRAVKPGVDAKTPVPEAGFQACQPNSSSGDLPTLLVDNPPRRRMRRSWRDSPSLASRPVRSSRPLVRRRYAEGDRRRQSPPLSRRFTTKNRKWAK